VKESDLCEREVQQEAGGEGRTACRHFVVSISSFVHGIIRTVTCDSSSSYCCRRSDCRKRERGEGKVLKAARLRKH